MSHDSGPAPAPGGQYADGSAWRFPNGAPAPAPAPARSPGGQFATEGDALLGEAAGLAQRLHGAAAGPAGPGDVATLIAEATKLLGTPSPGPAVDPAGGEPLGAGVSAVYQAVGRHAPKVAEAVGATTMQEAGTALAEFPRDVVRVMDGAGFFTQELSWRLLGQVARNAASAGPASGVLDAASPDAVAAHAAEHGLPDDLASIDSVTRFVASLPAKVRAGISPAMARDPALWGLAAALGDKMFGIELKRRTNR